MRFSTSVALVACGIAVGSVVPFGRLAAEDARVVPASYIDNETGRSILSPDVRPRIRLAASATRVGRDLYVVTRIDNDTSDSVRLPDLALSTLYFEIKAAATGTSPDRGRPLDYVRSRWESLTAAVRRKELALLPPGHSREFRMRLELESPKEPPEALWIRPTLSHPETDAKGEFSYFRMEGDWSPVAKG